MTALAGLCLALGTAAALAAPAQAAYPGGEGRLAYVRAGDIHTVDISEPTSDVRLTTAGDATGPRWSPDGKRIAYVRGAQLWVMNADGTANHRIGKLTGVGRPAWSPNGRYLAVAANGPDSPQYSTLYRVTVSSGAAVAYHSDITGDDPVDVFPNASPVAWSGDGTKIAAESISCQYGGLYEYCLSTLKLPAQNATQADETVDHGYTGGRPPYGRAHDPDWRPDSSGYLYTELLCQEEYTCDPPRIVLPGGGTIANASLAVHSPSGAHLAYVREDVRPVIFVSNADGTGEERQLVNATQPDWQPTQ